MYAPPAFDIASKMFLLLALPRTHAGQVGCSLKYTVLSCLCLTLTSQLPDKARLRTTLFEMAGAWTIVVYFCLTLPFLLLTFLLLPAPR